MADGEVQPEYLLPRSITVGSREVPIDTFALTVFVLESTRRPEHILSSGERLPPYPNPEDDEDIKHFHQDVSDMAQKAGTILPLAPPDIKEMLVDLDGLADARIAERAYNRAAAIRNTKTQGRKRITETRL